MRKVVSFWLAIKWYLFCVCNGCLHCVHSNGLSMYLCIVCGLNSSVLLLAECYTRELTRWKFNTVAFIVVCQRFFYSRIYRHVIWIGGWEDKDLQPSGAQITNSLYYTSLNSLFRINTMHCLEGQIFRNILRRRESTLFFSLFITDHRSLIAKWIRFYE